MRYIGHLVRMPDGQEFTIFRHVTLDKKDGTAADGMPVLVVRFRFARGSQRFNRWTSLLPIPLIVGFPGFREKLWMVDAETGYWQGVYQWESDAAAQEYMDSFVLSVVNRRAVPGTITCDVATHMPVSEFIT